MRPKTASGPSWRRAAQAGARVRIVAATLAVAEGAVGSLIVAAVIVASATPATASPEQATAEPTAPLSAPQQPEPNSSPIHLPQLGHRGRTARCVPRVDIQNLDAQGSVAAVVLWDRPMRDPGTEVPAGACAAESAPVAVRCVGPIEGGASVELDPAAVGEAASGAVFSLSTRTARELGLDRDGTVADYVCERLQETAVGDSGAWLAFRRAYDEGAAWQSLASLEAARGGRLAVEVERACDWPLPGAPDARLGRGAYGGVPADLFGSYDPVARGFVYLAPVVHADAPTLTTSIYLQNAAADAECATVEVELVPPRTDCPDGAADGEGDPACRLRLEVAPGSSATVDVAADMAGCLRAGGDVPGAGAASRGAARITSSRPLAVVLDSAGPDALTTYVAEPAWVEPPLAETAYDTRELAAFAPLAYAGVEAATGTRGWNTRLHVMSQGPKAALVRLELFDLDGTPRKRLDEWVCPGTSAAIDLGSIADLPDGWMGMARLRSMERSLGITGPEEVPSIVAVAESLRLAADGAPSEAHAYNLLPESRAFEWPSGHSRGGLDSGTGLIAVPRLELGSGDLPDGSRMAVANAVSDAGLTQYVVQVYDRNGLYDFWCRATHENETDYLDLWDLGLGRGRAVSAVVSAVYWQHASAAVDPAAPPRSLLGLAAVSVRVPYFSRGGPFDWPAGDGDLPGDASVASAGSPLGPGPGADAPPALDRPWCPGGHPMPWPTRGPLGTGTAGPAATPTVAPASTATPQLDPSLTERAWLPLVLGAARPVTPAATATPRPTVVLETTSPVWVPILDRPEPDSASVVVVQNVGGVPSKALVVEWAGPGEEGLAASAPVEVRCSGLIVPGTSWRLSRPERVGSARSAALYSLSMRTLRDLGADPGSDEPAADWLCRTLPDELRGSAVAWRAFHESYLGGHQPPGFSISHTRGAPLAVEVTTEGSQGDGARDVSWASYNGLSHAELRVRDAASGEYVYYAPLAYSGSEPLDAVVHAQNTGTMTATYRIVLHDRDACDRVCPCPPRTVAPGQSAPTNLSACALEGSDYPGSLTVRSDRPLAVVVDVGDRGRRSRTTARARTAAADFTGDPAPWADVGPVLYGPLVHYSQDWDCAVHVQNPSDDLEARVRVTWFDRGGDVVGTQTGSLCPGGSRSFTAPAGEEAAPWYLGNVRVDSLGLDPAAAGGTGPVAPIAGVLQMTRYRLPDRTRPSGAATYGLLAGGMSVSGAAALAVPSLTSALVDAAAEGSHTDTRLAIANVIDRPGFTDYVIYLYDRNGLVDYVCEKLNERQTEYLDMATWGYINDGFQGSAVISAMFWEHDVFDESGRFLRNLVGLGAVAVTVGGSHAQPLDDTGHDPFCATELPALSSAAVAAIAPPEPLACFSRPVIRTRP